MKDETTYDVALRTLEEATERTQNQLKEIDELFNQLKELNDLLKELEDETISC